MVVWNIRALAARLNELVRVMTESRTQGDRLRAEMTRLTDARTRLSGLLEQKKASLEQRQSELKRMRTAAAQISASVTDLNQLIAKLDQAVKDHTGLGDYDKEAREAVVQLARDAGMIAWHGGVLANSVAAEALTSVLIFMNRRYKVPGTGIRITGLADAAEHG